MGDRLTFFYRTVFTGRFFADLDIKRASSGFLDTDSSVDIGWVFTGTFPKKEKSIDIGFLNLGFSQELGSNFLLDGFGLGLGLLVFGIPGFLYQSTSGTKLGSSDSLYNGVFALF